jgi:hypothetical protein
VAFGQSPTISSYLSILSSAAYGKNLPFQTGVFNDLNGLNTV